MGQKREFFPVHFSFISTSMGKMLEGDIIEFSFSVIKKNMVSGMVRGRIVKQNGIITSASTLKTNVFIIVKKRSIY